MTAKSRISNKNNSEILGDKSHQIPGKESVDLMVKSRISNKNNSEKLGDKSRQFPG